MTPFEAKGWTKDTKFVVTSDKSRKWVYKKGTVVWLKEDDGTDCPAFTNGTGWCYYDFWELEPVVTEQTDLTPKPVTKDTVFDLKLTGEELVFLAVSLGDGRNPHTSKLDDSVYTKVSRILKKVADPAMWVNENPNTIGLTIKKVFPPQETPEQKQYKELLAQREALDVQLAQLSQKLNLKEKMEEEMSLAKLVLNQTRFYNGHGQKEISEMYIVDAIQLCRDMGKEYEGTGESRFILEVCPEYTDLCSASIYQVNGIKAGTNKLWLSIDKLII